MSSRARIFRRVGVGAVVMAGVIVGTAGLASAHVTIQETDQQADAYTVLTFGVPHGCDGSPTTKIRIQLPENVPTVTPTVNPNWDVAMVTEKLDTPIDLGEGETLTERITEVDYTAHEPLAANLRDALQLSLHIPADAAGTTMYFPTIQECEQGQTEWTMMPKEGQDPFELPTPSPFIIVSAATESEVAAAAPATDDDGNGLAIAALIVGIGGVVLGGAALVMVRKKPAPTA